MRSTPFQVILLIVSSFLMSQPASVAGQQRSQSYDGTWTGTYSNDNGSTGNLSYILSKDEKGQWHGTVKYTNQDGENTAELGSLQIADGKMKAKIQRPDVEVTIEGKFQGDQFEGTYAVSPKESTEVAEKGTWKVTRSSPAKAEK